MCAEARRKIRAILVITIFFIAEVHRVSASAGNAKANSSNSHEHEKLRTDKLVDKMVDKLVGQVSAPSSLQVGVLMGRRAKDRGLRMPRTPLGTNGRRAWRRLALTALESTSTTGTAALPAAAAFASASPLALDLRLDLDQLAQLLGYFVGSLGFFLYAPIIFRVIRQGPDSTEGLTLSSWWFKLAGYAISILYYVDRGYDVSTFIDLDVIAIEAAVLLLLIAVKQNRLFTAEFAGNLALFSAVGAWALNESPDQILAVGQAASTILTTAGLVPQLAQNAQRKDAGGYSPLTAGNSVLGCSIRVFTTLQLTSSDIILLFGFITGLSLNAILLGQILYYGMVLEGKSLVEVLGSDFASEPRDVTQKASPDAKGFLANKRRP